MSKLYIFDLDGTLVNSIYDLADSVNVVLERHKLPVHSIDEYRLFVGNGTLKLIERALPEEMRTDADISVYHKEFSEEYNRRAVEKTRPYDGILPLLNELKGRGCKIAVASNKPDKFSKFIVHTLFGEKYFDAVSGKKDGVPTKPAPDIVYDIMRRLGFDKEDCVFIGDSNVDVMTAHNSGLKCIGCVWGFRGRKELENAGADFIVESPSEIADIKF